MKIYADVPHGYYFVTDNLQVHLKVASPATFFITMNPHPMHDRMRPQHEINPKSAEYKNVLDRYKELVELMKVK